MIWINPNRRFSINPPKNIPYFLDLNSTTERARAIDPRGLRIDLRRSGFGRPLPEEARRLKIDMNHCVWLREVRICLLSNSIMFARAVIPYAALENDFRRIKHLGSRSLGHYLFHLPNIQREPFDIKKLQPGDWMYENLLKNECNTTKEVWARRSIFRSRSALLLTEIFLPEYSRAFGTC